MGVSLIVTFSLYGKLHSEIVSSSTGSITGYVNKSLFSADASIWVNMKKSTIRPNVDLICIRVETEVTVE